MLEAFYMLALAYCLKDDKTPCFQSFTCLVLKIHEVATSTITQSL